MSGRTTKSFSYARPVIENLETRVLFSADPLGLAISFATDAVDDSPLFNNDEDPHRFIGETSLTSTSQQPERTEIVFVSTAVHDYQKLQESVLAAGDESRSIRVFQIDSGADGVKFVCETLSEFESVDAVHFITHGGEAGLYLGDTLLNADNVAQWQNDIAGWANALSASADILFYGCELAGSERGLVLLDALGQYSQADIAASTDVTGHSSRGADWNLEHHDGLIESRVVVDSDTVLHWDSTLAVLNISSTVDEIDSLNGQVSLREAIRDANDGDIIQLEDAVYTLSLTAADDNGGDLDIRKSLTIRGVQGGNTTIDAQSLDRLLEISGSGTTVILQDLTLTNGFVASGDGGAVKIVEGQLEMTRVIAQNNVVHTGDGGALYVGSDAELSLADSALTDNQAGRSGVGDGGAIYNEGETYLIDVSLESNRSNEGGAIKTLSGLRIAGASFVQNTAVEGGAIYATNDADLTLVSVSFVDNSADQAGAVRVDGRLLMYNNTFSANTAQTGSGGALLLNANTQAEIVHTTFYGNQASDSGAAIETSASAKVSLKNSLFEANLANGVIQSINGSLSSDGYNLLDDVAFSSAGQMDIVGITAGLDAVADNGGIGQTHALQADSRAINAGGGTHHVDQTGTSRDEIPDIGAFEYRSVDSDGMLYWTSIDSNAIYRGSADSNNLDGYQLIVNTTDSPFDIEVDIVNERIYWVEADSSYGETGGLGSIKRANLDGSNVTTLVSGLHFPTGLALDVEGGFIYVTTNNNALTPGLPAENQILRYNLDGTFSRLIAQALDTDPDPVGMVAPTDVEYDAQSNRLFWTDRGDAALQGREVNIVILPSDPNGVVGSMVQLNSSHYTDTQVPHSVAVLPGGLDLYLATGSGIVNLDLAQHSNDYSGDLTLPDNLYGVAYGQATDSLYYTDHRGNIHSIGTNYAGDTPLFSGMSGLWGIAVAQLSDVGESPELTVNTGAAVAEGDAISLNSSMLQVSDADTGLAVQYTLSGALPAAGTLSNNGVALVAGDSFTQADINAGNIAYVHNGSEGATDSFEFQVSDGSTILPVATFDLAITPVNDAPEGVSVALLPVVEDTLNPAGFTLAFLLNGSFSDPDASASFSGVAVVANPADASQGLWQYSVDGSSWSDIGPVANVSALMLSESTLIRFVPASNYSGPVSSLSVRVLDETNTLPYTTVANAQFADVSVNGGATATSATAIELSINIISVNDPPTLANATLAAVDEDSMNNPGDTIQNLFGGLFSDVDSASAVLDGIAITANNADSNTEGSWQYSFDGGTRWVDVGVVSESAALVLDSSQRLRFVAVADFNGTPIGLSLHALDSEFSGNYTDANQRETMDTTLVQVNQSHSLSTYQLNTTITAVNDAPEAQAASLAVITEDAANPAGQSVATLFGGGFSDVDNASSLSGIAVVFNPQNMVQGRWQYSVDGSTWLDIGAVSENNALLLSSAAELRFVPAANYSGSVQAISAHVLDDTHTMAFTSQNNRVVADISNNGGSTAISSMAVSLNTTIVAENDAPTLGDATLTAIAEDSQMPLGDSIQHLFQGLFSDSDSGATLSGIALTANPATQQQGSWQYSLDATTWIDIGALSEDDALLLNASTLIRFLPTIDFYGTPSPLSVRAIDNSYSGAFTTDVLQQRLDASLAVNTAIAVADSQLSTEVLPVNDPPLIGNANLAAVYEGALSPAGQTIAQLFQPSFSDIDSDPAIAGIAVVGNPQSIAEGQWSYSTDGGVNWFSVAAVTPESALLLDYSSLVRFEPIAGFNGAPTGLSLHALDNDYVGLFTSGASRVSLDITTTPMNNSISLAEVQLNTQVLPISHAPMGSDVTLSVVRGFQLQFDTSSFGFSDVLDNDLLHSVTIVSLPATGELRFAGNAVVAGQAFSSTDLDSGRLVFVAEPGANTGPATASFTFFVTDTGSNANGGINQAVAHNTISINITLPDFVTGTIALDNTSIDENLIAGSVGDIAIDDVAFGDIFQVEVDDDRFEVVDGNLKLREGEYLDFESELEVPLTLTVINFQGQALQTTINLNVQNVNEAPEVQVQPAEQSVGAPWSFSLPVNTFVDVDGDELSYSAELEDGSPLPQWLVFDPESLEFSVTSEQAQTNQLRLRIIANDGNGATASTALAISLLPSMGAALPQISELPEPEQSQLPSITNSVSVANQTELHKVDAVAELPLQNSEAAERVEIDESVLEAERILPEVIITSAGQHTNVSTDTAENASQKNSTDQVGQKESGQLLQQLDTAPLSQLFKLGDTDTLAMFANLKGLLDQEWADSENQAVFAKRVIGTTVTVSSGISVGYVLWLVRSGTLIGSVLSTLPAWRYIDPLPILDSLDSSEGGDSESLESMVNEPTDTLYPVASGQPADPIRSEDSQQKP